MERKAITGIVVGGVVGFGIGIGVAIKYTMDNLVPGANPHLQTASVVVPVCLGAGVGYLIAAR